MAQVPLQRTVCTAQAFAAAFIDAWHILYGRVPDKTQCGVIYAQWIVETSGKACHNWNIGNVKVTPAQVAADIPWIDLPGTWEIVRGKRVTLPEGHPGRRFRAFESLSEGMRDHLEFLRRRFAAGWASVEQGDPDAFTHAIKAGRDGIEGTADDYFTAPVEAYARIMVSAFKTWMTASFFEDSKRPPAPSLQLSAESESESAKPEASEPTLVDWPIVHRLPGSIDDDEAPPEGA